MGRGLLASFRWNPTPGVAGGRDRGWLLALTWTLEARRPCHPLGARTNPSAYPESSGLFVPPPGLLSPFIGSRRLLFILHFPPPGRVSSHVSVVPLRHPSRRSHPIFTGQRRAGDMGRGLLVLFCWRPT